MALVLDKLVSDVSALEQAVKAVAPDIASVPTLQAQLKDAQDALAKAQSDAAAADTANQAAIDDLSKRLEAALAQIPQPAAPPAAAPAPQ